MNCPVCGQKVEVSGDTTHYYIPMEKTGLIQEFLEDLHKLYDYKITFEDLIEKWEKRK